MAWDDSDEHPLLVLGDVIVRVGCAVVQLHVGKAKLIGHLMLADDLGEK